jgi:hypothetical protein
MTDERIPPHKHGDFAEGVEHKPHTPDEELEPDFARGARRGPESELERKGRFSEGQEELPDDPEKLVERRFSEGIERGAGGD